jgi:hypothetical protein
VRGDGAEAQARGVDALDVDGGQRRVERARDLDRDGDTAPRDADDDGLLELEGADGLGQRAPGRLAIPKDGWDPRHDPHTPIVTDEFSPAPLSNDR